MVDAELFKLEKRIFQIYSKAQKELSKKLYDSLYKDNKKIESLFEEYEKALNTNDSDLIMQTKGAYQDALHYYVSKNKHYEEMVESVTKDMTQVNQQALSYINGTLPFIYSEGYQQIKETIDNTGISYTLADKHTIKRMIQDGDIKLPKKKLNVAKDIAWNTKRINSAVLQGILQGESINKISNRLLHIMDNNRSASIRNARTLVTGAENRGRFDSYKELEEQGIVMKKVWIATDGDRTRDWHAVMDGQEVDIDEPFIDGNGNELMYPADPDAEPETVYNCRCSMRIHFVGLKKNDDEIVDIDFDEELSEQEQKELNEWNEQHEEEEEDLYDWEKEYLEEQEELKEAYIEEEEEDIFDDIDIDTEIEDEIAQSIEDEITQSIEEEIEKNEETIIEFDEEAYSQERKDNALWAQSSEEADDWLRPSAERAWQEATYEERKAIYDYTADSNDQNMPLRGYDGSWSRHEGTENIELSRRDADRIEATTRYIDNSPLEQDTWLQRGVNERGAAAFLGIDESLFYGSEEDMKNAILGKVVTDDAFCSHGSSRGAGFDGVIFNTYCPEGTRAAYCEPFSRFGQGAKSVDWDGVSHQSYFGRELETLLQRGTSFNVTKISKNRGNWYIDIEVIAQNPKPLEEMFKGIY